MTDGQNARQLPWLMALASAFIAALAGLLAPAGTADVEIPARVALNLPEPVIAVTVLALIVVECAVLGYVVVSGRRRRKRKGDEDFELSYERPPVSPWIGVVLLVWTLLLAAVIVYLVRHGIPPIELGPTGGNAAAGPVSPTTTPPGLERPFVSIPFLTWSITAIAVLVAGGSLVLMIWLFFAQRLESSDGGATETAPLLVDAVDEGLDDLRRERDARIAIVKCYRRFEQAMARARAPRQPWQTPVEYMHAALSRLALPGRAVQGLTDLFEIARFSDHPVGSAEHQAAWTCLTEIRTVLDERRTDALSAS